MWADYEIHLLETDINHSDLTNVIRTRIWSTNNDGYIICVTKYKTIDTAYTLTTKIILLIKIDWCWYNALGPFL